MKLAIYLLSGCLLIASGAAAAGEPAPSQEKKTLQVRTIIKTHDADYYGVKREPGPSDRTKTPKADRPDAPYLRPKIVHIPKQEVHDEE
jgi:hypothetical protein